MGSAGPDQRSSWNAYIQDFSGADPMCDLEISVFGFGNYGHDSKDNVLLAKLFIHLKIKELKLL